MLSIACSCLPIVEMVLVHVTLLTAQEVGGQVTPSQHN